MTFCLSVPCTSTLTYLLISYNHYCAVAVAAATATSVSATTTATALWSNKSVTHFMIAMTLFIIKQFL